MTYLAFVASIQKSKSAVLVAVFVLCSALACWPQSAQANQPGSNPPRVGPVNRAAAQLEKLQPATLSGSRTQSQRGAIVIKEFKHDTGPLLREIAPLLPEFSTPSEHEIQNNVNPNHNWSNQVQKDPVLQTEENSPRLQTPNFGLEFDGAGFGDGFFCNCMPPDNDGAVGTTQYVQYINLEYQVFDKSGNAVLGPLAGNTFWSGFGGSCQADNSGDPIVRFDAAAQRWVVSQFAINGSGNDFECVAVSQTADATGAYNRYAFSFADFPDYPKMGVWPDAYYFTFNDFNLAGSAYVGVEVCAADRTKMLAGAAATMQCFPPSSSDFGMLPSDLDGATPPASGTPNFVMELDPSGSANIDMFKFHVDFTTPANSTFTGPTLIPVAAFTPLCNAQAGNRYRCVPQPTAGSDLLESLGDRLMWRLVYRNFGDHTTLLVSHSIVAGSSGGVRWYEIRNPETSPTVFQSGTFAPDTQYRWMPAIAMDASQDIAVGYSRSGAAAGKYPSLVYAGRIPSDPAGTLESEVVLKAGLGSQTGGGSRWGDYSSLTVDPTDDCTFWFSEEYEKVTGGFNWSTAIGSFSFPGCAAGTTPTITNLSPPSGPVGAPVTIAGANFGATKGTSTVTFNGTTATTITSWSAISIVAPVPAGATTGNVVVTVGGVASNGSAFTVSVVPTIVWSQPSAITYGTTLSGILNATAVDGSNPVPGSFAYTATLQGGSPIGVTDSTVLGGGSYTLTANFTPTDNVNYASASGTVSLTVGKATPTNGLGTSVNPVLAQTSVTFTATVSSSAGTPSGNVRFYDGATLLGTVTLAQGVAAFTTSSLAAANHSITAVYGGDSNFLTVTSSVLTETVEDFALTVPTGDPTSATVSAGGTASYTVHVAPSNAQTFLSAIALNVTGAPAGATVTFLPPSLAAGAGATDVSLKVLVASQTAPIHSSGLLLKLSPVMAGMLLLPFSGKFRRAAGKHQRAVRLLLLFLATTSLAGIMACGGGSSSTSGNGPKIYTLTVTGASGTDSHTTNLTLTVQ